MSISKLSTLKVVALCCLVMGSAFIAVQAGAGEDAKQQQAAKDLPTLYAVRDASTGQLRPMTEDERKAAGLPELLKRDSAGLQPKAQADGSVVTPLVNTYQNAVMIKRNPDGTFTTTCVDTMDAARKFVSTKAASEADHAK